MTVYEFALLWKTQSLFWRVRSYVIWVGLTMWCAVRLRPGPGELLLLKMMADAQSEDKTRYHQQFAEKYLKEITGYED